MGPLQTPRGRGFSVTTLVLAAASGMAPGGLGAQQTEPAGELVTDRPDVTESTSVVPPGWLQGELGASYERGDGSRTLAAPGTLLRVGVTRRLEARLGWSGWQDLSGDGAPEPPGGSGAADGERAGAADGEVGLKALVLDRRGRRPDLALLPSLTLPLGQEGLGSGAFDPGLKALLANDLPGEAGWGANVGLAWPTQPGDGGDSRSAVLSWSYSVGLPLGGSWAAFAEYFGEAAEGAVAGHWLDGGLTHRAGPDLQLDGSGGVALGQSEPDWFLGAGLSFRLGRR